MNVKFKVGQEVVWVPSEANDPDWGHNDEWNNELSYSANRALTPQEMDEYMVWSEKVQHGTVERLCEEFAHIRLLEPFGTFNPITHVTYPLESDLGEYWARVQESPDFKKLCRCMMNEQVVDRETDTCETCGGRV